MIENGPEHFGWSAMCREANGCFPTREAFMKGLAAYEAARPKLPTITGLPETLPDGTRIVGWAWRKAGHGEWWFAGGAFGLIQGPAFEARPVAITEADNDRS